MSDTVWTAIISGGIALLGVFIGVILSGKQQARQQQYEIERRREELYIGREIEVLSSLYVAILESFDAIVADPSARSPHPTMKLPDYMREVIGKHVKFRRAAMLANAYVTKQANEAILAAFNSQRDLLQYIKGNHKPTPIAQFNTINMELPREKVEPAVKATDAALDCLRPLLNPKSPKL